MPDARTEWSISQHLSLEAQVEVKVEAGASDDKRALEKGEQHRDSAFISCSNALHW